MLSPLPPSWYMSGGGRVGRDGIGGSCTVGARGQKKREEEEGGDPLWLLGLPRGALVAEEKEEEEDGPKEKVGGKVIWDRIKGRRLPYVRGT